MQAPPTPSIDGMVFSPPPPYVPLMVSTPALAMPPTPSIHSQDAHERLRVILVIVSKPEDPLDPPVFAHFYQTPSNRLESMLLDVHPDPSVPTYLSQLSQWAWQEYRAAVDLIPMPLSVGDIYTSSKISVTVLHLLNGVPPSAPAEVEPEQSIIHQADGCNYILFVAKHGQRTQFYLMPSDSPEGQHLLECEDNDLVFNQVDNPIEWAMLSQFLADCDDLTSLDQILAPRFYGVLPSRSMVHTLTLCIR